MPAAPSTVILATAGTQGEICASRYDALIEERVFAKWTWVPAFAGMTVLLPLHADAACDAWVIVVGVGNARTQP